MFKQKVATIKPYKKLKKKDEKRAFELQRKLLLLSEQYKDIPMVFLNNVQVYYKPFASDVDFSVYANSNLSLGKD